MNLNSHNLEINIKKLNYKDLIIFLIPFILFLYYLHIYNPGILTVDSFNQLHQIATGKFNNWHPFFHTFIEMLCIKIYASPISVGILQITIFSVMWMVICKYFRQDDLNKTLKSKSFILQVAITLIISLIPINAIYSITLWKDILFSYFLMFLCFLIKVLLDKEGQISYKFIILLSIVMAFVSQLRPNGIFIILVLLIIFGIYLFRKNKTDKMFLILPALTIIFILLIASLNVAYDVEDNQKDAVFAKIVHMLADYDLNLEMSNEDRAKIHEMMNETTIKENYKDTYSDLIWDAADEQVYDNNKATYLGMAISYSLKNPLHFIEYMFKSSPMVWDLTRSDDWVGNVYKTDINNANRFFYRQANATPAADFDGVMATNSKTNEYQQLNSMAYAVRDNPITDTLFESTALYMYLAIILLIAINLITKSKTIYLVYLPNLLNILIVFVSTPIQDVRYLYPNLLIFYLLVIILIGILTKEDSKITTNTSNVNKIKNTPNPKIIEKENMRIQETPEEMEARITAEILKELELEYGNKKE